MTNEKEMMLLENLEEMLQLTNGLVFTMEVFAGSDPIIQPNKNTMEMFVYVLEGVTALAEDSLLMITKK